MSSGEKYLSEAEQLLGKAVDKLSLAEKHVELVSASRMARLRDKAIDVFQATGDALFEERD